MRNMGGLGASGFWVGMVGVPSCFLVLKNYFSEELGSGFCGPRPDSTGLFLAAKTIASSPNVTVSPDTCGILSHKRSNLTSRRSRVIGLAV